MTHSYQVQVEWTGNLGVGTRSYLEYSRNHVIRVEGKPDIDGSSDPAFRGDPTRYNPEEMLVSALSTCHMLWFLHICADAGVVVTSYTDTAVGRMGPNDLGNTVFKSVELNPDVALEDPSQRPLLARLHHEAHGKCFIANSVNFPVVVVDDVGG